MERNSETISFVNRKAWRGWLRSNHERRREVWLVLPKKSATGISYRIYYNEALEEAICFGWIDSRIKSLDAMRSMVRFTPRRSQNWSRYNIEKALKLIGEGRMTPAGLKVLPQNVAARH